MILAINIIIFLILLPIFAREFFVCIAKIRSGKNRGNGTDLFPNENKRMLTRLYLFMLIAMEVCAAVSFPQTNFIVTNAIVESKEASSYSERSIWKVCPSTIWGEMFEEADVTLYYGGEGFTFFSNLDEDNIEGTEHLFCLSTKSLKLVGYSARQMAVLKTLYLLSTIFLLKNIITFAVKDDASKYNIEMILSAVAAIAGVWIYVMPLFNVLKYVYSTEPFWINVVMMCIALYVCIFYIVWMSKKESGRHIGGGAVQAKSVREPKNLLDMALLAEAAGTVKLVKAYVGRMIYTGNIGHVVNQQDGSINLFKCQMSEPTKYADSLIYKKLFDKEKVFYGGMDGSIVGYETVRWIGDREEFNSIWKEGEYSRRLAQSSTNDKESKIGEKWPLFLFLPIASALLSWPMFDEAGFGVIIMNIITAILSMLVVKETKGSLLKRFVIAMIPEVLTIVCDIFFWADWLTTGRAYEGIMHIAVTVLMYIVYLSVIASLNSSKYIPEDGLAPDGNPYRSILKHFSSFVMQCTPEEFKRISKGNDKYGISMLPYAYMCDCQDKWLTMMKEYEKNAKSVYSAEVLEKYEQLREWFRKPEA